MHNRSRTPKPSSGAGSDAKEQRRKVIENARVKTPRDVYQWLQTFDSRLASGFHKTIVYIL